MELRYTLLSDGSSDRVLISVLNWLLHTHLSDCAIQPEWADLRHFDRSLTNTLEKRIQLSIELYQCELLFIHRDSERDSHTIRVNEIRTTVNQIESFVSVPTVCVVPVRMTEAWLLFDIVALRQAASNPNGSTPLRFPELRRLEHQLDPKDVLYNLLRQASGLSSRRLKGFPVSDRAHRVAELINDFSPLRILPAFAALESELKDAIEKQGWESC